MKSVYKEEVETDKFPVQYIKSFFMLDRNHLAYPTHLFGFHSHTPI